MPTEDKPKKSNKQEQEEWDYIGNVWGWKFSLIGLAVITFLFLLMFLRWNSLEQKPDNIFVPKHPQTIDSTKVN